MRSGHRRALLLLIGTLAVACRQDMHDQPKYKPLRPSAFFADGQSSRPAIEGTVARGTLPRDEAFVTGKVGTERVREAPVPFTPALLARGQVQYDAFCSVCHDRVGMGQGMIVLRGFRQPPSLHIDRLRAESDGYFFDVITNGFGVMPKYAQQIAPEDRWAIVAYVRALQLSQNATLADVPPAERARLQKE